jgi:hypothetical protein
MRIVSVMGAATVAVLLAGMSGNAAAQSISRAVRLSSLRAWAPGSVSRASSRVRRTSSRIDQRSRGVRNAKHKKHGEKCKGRDDENRTVRDDRRLPPGMCWDRNGDGICDSNQGTVASAGRQVIYGRNGVYGQTGVAGLMLQQVGSALLQRLAYSSVAHSERGIR